MPIQSRDASSPWSWWMIGSPGASAVGDGFLRQSFRLPQRRCFRRSLLFEIGFQSEGRCAEGGKGGGLPERPVRWLLNRCQGRSGGRGCSAGASAAQGIDSSRLLRRSGQKGLVHNSNSKHKNPRSHRLQATSTSPRNAEIIRLIRPPPHPIILSSSRKRWAAAA